MICVLLHITDIPLPDREARKELFALNLREVQTDETVSLDELADRSEGYSGADITSVEYIKQK